MWPVALCTLARTGRKPGCWSGKNSPRCQLLLKQRKRRRRDPNPQRIAVRLYLGIAFDTQKASLATPFQGSLRAFVRPNSNSYLSLSCAVCSPLELILARDGDSAGRLKIE